MRDTKTKTFFGILLTLVLAAPVALPLAASADDGKEIFLEKKCNSCHTVKSLGIELRGEPEDPPTDLSDVGTKHDAKFLEKYLTKKAEVDGEKHKVRYFGPPPKLKALATWLAGLKTGDEEAEEKPEGKE